MQSKHSSRRIYLATHQLGQDLRKIICILLLLGVCSATRVCAQSDGGPDPADPPPTKEQNSPYLFGDWNGERSKLASKGVNFEFYYVTDLLANPVGGNEQADAGWGRTRGTVDIDFGRLTEWNGLLFHATGVWQFGGNLGDKIGVLANPSGLVSKHATRLDSWWFQQALLHNRVFVKVGQFAGQDYYGNQNFNVSYVGPLNYAFANLFLTTYESFNPAATPAFEVFFPARRFFLKSAVLAGNRDQFHQDPTGFHFQIRNTPVFVFETGYTHHPEYFEQGKECCPNEKSYPSIWKIGASYNGGKFPDATGRQSKGNYLIYTMANQGLYRAEAGSSRGLDVTVGFDWSPDDVNKENSQFTAGFRYNGPITSRPKDTVAFSFADTKIADPFKRLGIPLGAPALGSEKAIELNYTAQLTPYFLVQPVFEYYVDVGAKSHVPNAAVFGFRTKIDF